MLDDTHAPAIEVRRPAAPGQFIAYTGSDIARGETLLRKGTLIGSREIGMLAVAASRRSMWCGGRRSPYSRPAMNWCRSVRHSAAGIILQRCDRCCRRHRGGWRAGVVWRRPPMMRPHSAVMRRAFADNDMQVVSGGTSKGAGDISHRIVSGLGNPGSGSWRVRSSRASRCALRWPTAPVIVLPGFPTSAIFTFHAFVAPVIRAWPDCPPRMRARSAHAFRCGAAVRTRPQGVRAGRAGPGRRRHDRVSVAQGLRLRYRILAGGWFRRDRALASALDAETIADVTLIGTAVERPIS